MSKRPRSIPVGVLVSVSDSRRRRPRFKSLAEYPPIKREAKSSHWIGMTAAGLVPLLLAIICIWALSVQVDRAPAAAVVQPPLQAFDDKPAPARAPRAAEQAPNIALGAFAALVGAHARTAEERAWQPRRRR